MDLHHFSIQKTARYATYGTWTKDTQSIWFVCHGYGQLAEYFIKKFDILDSKKHFVVAPEALSKFYLERFTGRVGATWMTKEDRVNEIKDYLNYLNELYSHITKGKDINKVKVNLLGFSQGTATIARWLFDEKVKCDRLILWAGNLAHDLDFSKSEHIFQNAEVLFVYGTKDELIKQEYFEEQKKIIRDKGIQAKFITFDGKHEIDRQTLLKIAQDMT